MWHWNVLVNVNGIYMARVDHIACGSAVFLRPSNGQGVVAAFFDSVLADTCSSRPGWAFWNNGNIGDIALTNCWAASSTANVGMDFQNPNTNGVSVCNSRIINNDRDGVVIAAGTNIQFESCQVFCNGKAAIGTYSGFAIGNNVSGFKIIGCDIGLGGNIALIGGPVRQKYGIFISQATDDFIISMNRLHKNLVGGIYNGSSGTNYLISGNIES